ncbi:SusC/RagA family TonB-linked outer membrane protein [Mucilaginibacter sp.]|uniref:SusC/RagA family TonB-linked outer membrane protein n=1 Tax=Mucilaginibacter sp. TaxID=1882438 RepID=UPI0026129259|nr:SusC/RagA family TonB-linked outer membrane protein [Mucilaginibacter sp.]MDB5032725.1 SusC/RagA family TonB-linked outer membrane protein [Mucilaginibacter sp.]
MKHLSKLCFLGLFLFIAVQASAQNKVITGRVTNKTDGSALVGVTVVASTNAGTGTVTDADGKYRLSVGADVTSLIFSYTGFAKQQINIAGKSQIDVSLEASISELTEVVVIGYGTQRVKDATGSVASLGNKDFNKGVISTPEQLLQGRIAGVQVTPSNGEPGGSSTINIRGSSSIRSGNDPLYVIDGVPIQGGGTSNSGPTTGSLGSSSARNPLEFINPADIENISVLKDASASAIYGSRGANGVILITTKKGARGQGIQFTSNTTVGSVAKKYNLLTASQFLTAVAATGADANAVNQKANTDWQKQIFRTAVSQNTGLAFGGAKDGFTYRSSFSYDDENGTVKNSGLKRLTGRINASQSFLDDKLKFDLTFLASNIKNTYAPIADNSGYQGSLIGATIGANPTYPIYNPDGTYYFDGSNRNPVAMLNLIDDKDNINRYLGNLGASLKITNNLTYRATFGNDYGMSKRTTYYDPKLAGYTDADNVRGLTLSQISGNGRGQIQNVKQTSQITEHTLTYDLKFRDFSTLTVLAGYSYQVSNTYNWNQVGWNTTTANTLVKSIDAFKNHLPIYGDTTRSQLQSYYSRINYSYKDRYLVTATVRRDGSSKFGANNKYATFPALAVKWKIMNESFAPKNIFEDFSLRINYGKTGNQELPPYASLEITQYNLDGSKSRITNANPNLKWETVTQTGAGIDFALIGGQLTGTLDYFNKSTKDLLFLQDYAQPAANTHRWVNLPGNIVNKGFELGLNLAAVRHKIFSWDIAYNMTILSNKVENFGNSTVNTGAINGQGLSGAYGQVIINNYPLYTFKLPQYAGLDANGFAIYPNGIDIGTLQGSALPKFTTSLTNNFTYGRFNASVFINAATGFYVYNNTANAYFYRGNLVTGHNVTPEVAASSENVLNSGQLSTRFLEKGDFVRLSNVTFGYTFDLIKPRAIKTLRLSVSGQNLALITNYSGLDPEINTNKALNNVPSRGIDYASYPKARTFTFSLNAGF